jgi:hypothetical protein
MDKILSVRSQIYDQFQNSSAGPEYFYLKENSDIYAAFYTAKYLIQDTGEAVYCHMKSDFSKDPMFSYLEFWGVMQAIVIQQDAICKLYSALTGSSFKFQSLDAWQELRTKRNLCAGHPAKQLRGQPAPRRAFMGRMPRTYRHVEYEVWDAGTDTISHPIFDLRDLIERYDSEAAQILQTALNEMKRRWP